MKSSDFFEFIKHIGDFVQSMKSDYNLGKFRISGAEEVDGTMTIVIEFDPDGSEKLQ